MSNRQEQLRAVSVMPRNKRVSAQSIQRIIKSGLDLGLTNPSVRYGADGSVDIRWSAQALPRFNEWDT